MSDKDEDETRQPPTEKLAALVEQRKRDAAEGQKTRGRDPRAERAAAARSASKSKPAPRK